MGLKIIKLEDYIKTKNKISTISGFAGSGFILNMKLVYYLN
jgi:hypothetical protein